jgi:DUF971 family protein
MNTYPTKLERIGDDRLRIEWNDGLQSECSVRRLREACPCATCREKRAAPPAPPNVLPVLKPEETVPLRISGMKPIGSYAYAIQFTDGHDTGIYTFELLRELGTSG